MAVAYVTDVDATPATSSSVVFPSITISGTTPAVVVALALASTTESVSSISLGSGLSGGTPYRVKKVVTGATTVDIWAIPSPSGAGVITVTLSGSAAHQGNAALFAPTHATIPCPTGDAVSLTGSGDLTPTPTNLTANDAAYAMGANALAGDGPDTNHAPNTEIFNNNTSNVNAAAAYHLGTGGILINWGSADVNDAAVGVRITEVDTGGGGPSPVIPNAPITSARPFPYSPSGARRR